MELTYTKQGDYYIPDLDIPAQEKVPVNRYGRMHGNYLKKNNRTAYNELLFSGRLNRYLAELGEQAEKMLALLTEQYAAAEKVTEETKASDHMGWVRAMNSIRNRAEEVVLSKSFFTKQPQKLTFTLFIIYRCKYTTSNITVPYRGKKH